MPQMLLWRKPAVSQPANLSSGLLAARPAAGVGGRYYIATDLKIIYYDNGTTWVSVLLGV